MVLYLELAWCLCGTWMPQQDISKVFSSWRLINEFCLTCGIQTLRSQIRRVLTYQQVLHQRLHVLGRLRRRGIMGRQFDQRRQEVLAFFHVLLHLLQKRMRGVWRVESFKSVLIWMTHHIRRVCVQTADPVLTHSFVSIISDWHSRVHKVISWNHLNSI